MDQLVSIIIPLYNSQEHIEETIQSALSQTWKNIEIIIIDDGSTDQSLSIARRFECEKVKILTQENKGASAARNHGLEVAKGDYIQFLDADDLLSHDKIEKQVWLLNHSTDKLTFCRLFDLIGEKPIPKDNNDYSSFSTEKPQEFLTHFLSISGVVLHLGIHAWLIPSTLIKKAGPWSEGLSLDDDGEFMLRIILEAQGGIVFSPQGACYYRKHPHTRNLSSQNDYKAIKSSISSHDLKLESLEKKNLMTPDLQKRFVDGYQWLAVNTYPNFPDLYNYCTQKVQNMGGSEYRPVPNRPIKKMIQACLGWKTVRMLEATLSWYQRARRQH